jgi:hypothetical protein
MVVTQPHTIAESTLLRYFTPIQKKPNNTFSHTLYIMHRDFLAFRKMKTRRSTLADLDEIEDLINVLDDPAATRELLTKCIEEAKPPAVAYTVEVEDLAIGMYVLSKDVNL